MSREAVAVLGLGQMGSRYAERLIRAGLEVTVWNRTAARSEPLAAAGARVASSPADAADSCDIMITAFENAGALTATLLTAETRAHLSSRHLVIDTSTVHPRDALAAQMLLHKHGAHYLDAPVSGGTRGAANGTLTLLVGGALSDFERARPVLEHLGTPHRLGPTGAGHVAKLVNQAIVAVTIGAVAEGLYLAERCGVDVQQLMTALRGGFADSRVLREHGDRMLRRDFLPGGTNRIFLKDLNEIRKLADEHQAELPLTRLSQAAYAELIAVGYGEHDHSSYFEYLELINKTAPQGEI